MGIKIKNPDKKPPKGRMGYAEARKWRADTGEFAPGYSRCMDCRCAGKPGSTCPGESDLMKANWQRMMENEKR